MASIRLDHVTKIYPGGQPAVRELDLDVTDGELLVLVGPSGCGKTTTLRLVSGLEAPTDGTIHLAGKDVTGRPPHQRDVAMVFQNYALYPYRSVRGNLEFPLRLQRRPRREIRQRVTEIAQLLSLDHVLDRRPDQLSGGEQQRVALGRALVRWPSALLLDEPLSNLDAQLRVHLRTELLRLHRQLGTTMLYVTHDQEEAVTLGQRVAVLRAGVLQQLAPPTELYRWPVNTFVAGFIGTPAMNLLPCIATEGEQGTCLQSPFFTMACSELQLPPSAARNLLLGIRPHDMELCDRKEADVAGEVELVQVLGAARIVHVHLSAADQSFNLTVAARAEEPVQPQDAVGLKFQRQRLHYFDAASGQRLASTGDRQEKT